ncbi:non-structural maintenance of chromosomes element 1 homolog [Acanthaster planci]|uniref:Non-structural maintenance of chromosomes element 1 homolog n=1 Tax=Acanthaster planci TaxID=133434 RepID=A0A8B7YFT4_ACAPL|nr:non-structural maintenance of chromosomes element 1 homolog [Acanthaster planci]XP_022092108.1 non-structural maintenance of chromosomes element 1 homolog [Acanthaster planci]
MTTNDAHRLALQSFLSRGVMSITEVKELHKTACETFNVHFENTMECLQSFLEKINENISSVGMEIRSKKDEEKGKLMFALVRTTESELGRLSSDYQKNDLELFKKILDLIVESESGSASSTDVLNLTSHLKEKMSKQEAQKILSRLIKEKWLTESQGEISLSPRSMMELEHYLADVYEEDVRYCHLCKEIALKGELCSCGLKLHSFCAARLFRGKSDFRCPGCEEVWDYDIPLDERASNSATSKDTVTGRKRKERL